MAIASFPTKYLVFGFSDLIALKMTSKVRISDTLIVYAEEGHSPLSADILQQE
jgi:hypothetical protein